MSVVMSLCPSVRMEQLYSHGTDIHKLWYLRISKNSVYKIQWQESRVLYMKTYVHLW